MRSLGLFLIAPLSFLACESSDPGPELGANTGGTGTGGAVGASSGGSSMGTGAAPNGVGGSGATSAGATFRVQGRQLYDRCGEEVILRGVNEMIVWSEGRDGVPEYAEIAKTGANAVRIVWTAEGTAEELDRAIQNAVDQKLIPIVENHDATGDLSLLPDAVAYFTRFDVNAVLKKHEAYLLLNIANEAGDNTVTAEQYTTAYQAAIDSLRNSGLKLPLILDAPSWGQNIDVLQAAGPGLIEYDGEHNLMFSVHMWWHDPEGTRVQAELDESVAMGLPLMVGEFAQHAVYQCDAAPFAYTVLLAEAQTHGISLLAWSWGGVENNDCKDEGSFDMTKAGVFGDFKEEWGEAVAVSDPNSIKNTSVIPKSMALGSCSP